MGFLSDLFSGKKGEDIGNLFGNQHTSNLSNNAIQAMLEYQGSKAGTDPLESSRIATQEVQSNPILSQLFGKAGTLGRTAQEEQNLASRGYSLQPEDYEAYGQGSGQIARDFDASEQGLAQALAARGLSQSGSANRAFITSQGNKLERLGQLQRQISNDRMQSNLARLGQTRQFLSQLGSQGAGAIQDQFGRQQAAEGMKFGQTQAKANQGMGYLGAQQDANLQRAQHRAQTATGGLAGALSGGLQAGLYSGLANAPSMIAGGTKKRPENSKTVSD